MNVAAGNDTLSIWVDPDLTAVVAPVGLPAADFTSTTVDFADSIAILGVPGYSGSASEVYMDAIRMSSSPTGFTDVVGVGGSVGNDFSDWIGSYSVGGQTAIDDDPDSDGVESGVENFLGTAPDTFSQGLLAESYDGSIFTFTHSQGTLADDLSSAYRWSTDLATFNADGATDGSGTTVNFTVQLNTPSVGTTTVTATITGTATERLFVVVEVTQ